jgi:hypothetical protein
MSRNLAFLSGILVATAAAGGCTFKKASPGEVNPGTGGSDDGDGGEVHEVGIDIIAPPMSDSGPFESDVMLNCIEANPQTMNLPPDILIVLDRSNSMSEDLSGMTCTGTAGCGANSKWSVATTTLNGFLPTVETTVNWGLKLFGSSTQCVVSDQTEVAPMPMNAAAIMARLGQTMPGSSTPTTLAMMAAATYLKSLTDPNPKFILLATDGIPTCGSSTCVAGANAGGTTVCDDANAIAAVKAAADMGISTFVLGIGTANSPGDSTLSMMAINGGYPRNATPAYYPVGSAQDLSAAFMTITGMAGSCFFAVTPVPKNVTDITGVTGDGTAIPQDSTDGWTFVTMGTSSGVQLNGKSCDDYKNKVIQNVVVQLPCIEP